MDMTQLLLQMSSMKQIGDPSKIYLVGWDINNLYRLGLDSVLTLTATKQDLDKKQDKLGFTPVNKAGDSNVGSLGIHGNITASGNVVANGNVIVGAHLVAQGDIQSQGGITVAGAPVWHNGNIEVKKWGSYDDGGWTGQYFKYPNGILEVSGKVWGTTFKSDGTFKVVLPVSFIDSTYPVLLTPSTDVRGTQQPDKPPACFFYRSDEQSVKTGNSFTIRKDSVYQDVDFFIKYFWRYP